MTLPRCIGCGIHETVPGFDDCRVCRGETVAGVVLNKTVVHMSDGRKRATYGMESPGYRDQLREFRDGGISPGKAFAQTWDELYDQARLFFPCTTAWSREIVEPVSSPYKETTEIGPVQLCDCLTV